MALTETMSSSVEMVPEEGVIVIQGAFTVATHVLSLERLFERTTVWGDGSVPPLVVEKVRVLGMTCKAHDGFTKPRSIANVNAVPPRIVDVVCRIGAVRRLWTVIRFVLCNTKPFRCFLTHRREVMRAGMVLSNDRAEPIFSDPTGKPLVGQGENMICRCKHAAGATWMVVGGSIQRLQSFRLVPLPGEPASMRIPKQYSDSSFSCRLFTDLNQIVCAVSCGGDDGQSPISP